MTFDTRFIIILFLSVCLSPNFYADSKEESQAHSQQELLDDETDLWYWNDYEPSTVDNPTTPLIREDLWQQTEDEKPKHSTE